MQVSTQLHFQAALVQGKAQIPMNAFLVQCANKIVNKR